MEKQSLNDNIKYPLFCAGRISKKQFIKCILNLSVFLDIIKSSYDIDDKNPHLDVNMPNYSVGIKKMPSVYGKTPNIYFYINHYVPQSCFGKGKYCYRYNVYSLSPKGEGLVSVGSTDYFIDPTHKCIYISNMNVDDNYKHHGLGSSMHKEIENLACRLKMEAIVLDSVVSAIKFHRHNYFHKRDDIYDGYEMPHCNSTEPMIKRKFVLEKKEKICPFAFLIER